MKKLIITTLLCSSLTSQAAPDSTYVNAIDTAAVFVDTTSNKGDVDLDVFLMSRYAWRGVQFGTGPTIQAQLSYTKGGFMAAGYVAKSTYGGATGYPNTSNIMLGYQYKGVTVTVDDYFFYDEDNLDRYLDWSDTTLHFIETRLRYDHDRFYGMAGYNVYAAKGANKALYVEVGYKVPKQGLLLFAGYLFDRSDLNFSTSAGMTNVGITKQKEVKINDHFSLPLFGTLMVNLNYKNVVDTPGVGRNFLTLVVGVSL